MKINIFPPAVTIFVKELPLNVGGRAQGPFIKILEKYKTDSGIIAHELTHVKQFWFAGIIATCSILSGMYFLKVPVEFWSFSVIGMAMHSALYMLVEKYRLFSEVDAYAEQNEHYEEDKSVLFGSYISKNYRLNISAEEATRLLKI